MPPTNRLFFLSPFDSALVRAQTYTDDIGGSDDKGSPDLLIQCMGDSSNLPQPIFYIVKLASRYRFTGSSKYSLNSGLFVGVWFLTYGCLQLYFMLLFMFLFCDMIMICFRHSCLGGLW